MHPLNLFLCIYTYICVCVCVCVCVCEKDGNKSDSMKMYIDEKTQGFQWIILFVEIFANITH